MKEEMEMQKQVEELTLLLLYLTSWQEEDLPDDLRRSWKGYPFESLNQLMEKGLLLGSKKAKSVYLSKAGVEEAKKLMENYLGEK